MDQYRVNCRLRLHTVTTSFDLRSGGDSRVQVEYEWNEGPCDKAELALPTMIGS